MSIGAGHSPRGVVESSVWAGAGGGSFTGYREELDSVVLHQEFSSSAVVVLIGFGEPVTVMQSPRGTAGGTSRSVVAGLRTRVATTGHQGTQHGIAIRMDPLLAFRLFAVPMHEISDDLVDAAALLGLAGALLTEQLAETPSWRGRFELLEHTLAARIAAGPSLDPAVVWAWRALRNRPHTASIADLATRIGWSRRHFERRFRYQVGLPPATAARILRFERALATLAAGRWNPCRGRGTRRLQRPGPLRPGCSRPHRCHAESARSAVPSRATGCRNRSRLNPTQQITLQRMQFEAFSVIGRHRI
jgi:AraC-like DNA-binding protein